MKEKLFSRIVKNEYNNKLEKVLSNKDFSKDVKNSLLNIFYKIENGYNDYVQVKRNTIDEKKYIEKLLSLIEKNCNKIEFVKQNKEEAKELGKRGFKVEKKQITCYPIEIKLLYAIAQTQKKDIFVNYLDKYIEKAISNALNIGNNLNFVEPIRDFNGFSWNIIVKDIENLNYNLIYQNLILLVGNDYLEKWVNNYEPLVDYFELFESKLENNYGKENKNKIIENIIKFTIMMEYVQNETYKRSIERQYKKYKNEKIYMDDKENYLAKITKNKKQIEKKIKDIDIILNDKELILEEYENRNSKLPLEKKIFSIRILKNIMIQEREKAINRILEYNKMMDSRYFLERKNLIEVKLKYIQIIENQNLQKEIEKTIFELQKEILECLELKIINANEKNDLINLIYEYRYYKMLPVSKTKKIYQIRELQEKLEKVDMILIKKAVAMKIIASMSKDEIINYNILKNVFLSKIISLEDIYIKITEENDSLFMQFYDEQIEDEKIKINNLEKEKLLIKVNKKIKLFS